MDSFSIEGGFDTSLFQPRYQRNNKRGGLKNLRCFPTCATQHKERGFCGRPVLMRVITSNPDNIHCWAEFGKTEEPKTLSIGHSISMKEAESLSRSKEEPLKPWIRGALVQSTEEESVFEFNREKRGWHYGWASNKHTCNSSHILIAYILEKSPFNSEMLIVKGIVESPPFMLFCRRRRRFTVVPSAPISEPKKSKSKKQQEEEFSEEEDEIDEEEEEIEEFKEKLISSKKRSSPATKIPLNQKKVKNQIPTQSKAAEYLNVFPITNGQQQEPISLDKNRVDALLTVLHMAWRKMKTEGEATTTTTAAATTTTDQPLATQNDTEFFEMLDFLAGSVEFDQIDGFSNFSENPSNDQLLDDLNDDEEVDPDTEALAKYLLEQSDFRQSVLWLRGQGAHPDFSAFIAILRDHIQMYMKFRFWNISDIDRLIQNSFSTEQQLPQNIIVKSEPSTHWHVDGENFVWGEQSSSNSSPREFLVDSYCIPNISGSWKQTRESQIAMEHAREQSGSSWVMSKLFEFMESKFTIQQRGLELSCRIWPLPSLQFILDGEEHPWGIRLPLFQPNWKYRAWTDGKVIILQHQIENRRLTRKYWCDEHRQHLYSEATLEIYEEFHDRFVIESRIGLVAIRVG